MWTLVTLLHLILMVNCWDYYPPKNELNSVNGTNDNFGWGETGDYWTREKEAINNWAPLSWDSTPPQKSTWDMTPNSKGLSFILYPVPKRGYSVDNRVMEMTPSGWSMSMAEEEPDLLTSLGPIFQALMPLLAVMQKLSMLKPLKLIGALILLGVLLLPLLLLLAAPILLLLALFIPIPVISFG